MKMNLYSIYDNKALVYAIPFCAANHATALRMFGSACEDRGTNLNKYPNDFCLYCIGEFDDSNGMVITNTTHINLGLAAQFSNDVNPKPVNLLTSNKEESK